MVEGLEESEKEKEEKTICIKKFIAQGCVQRGKGRGGEGRLCA